MRYCDLISLEAKTFLQWQHGEKNSNDKAEDKLRSLESLLGIDTATCSVPTDLNVCFLVSWHLFEAERRDVTPHAKSPGNASTRVAGIYQVCREGEQPAQKQQHYVVNTGLYTHSSTEEESAKTQWLLFRQTRIPTSTASTLHYWDLIFSYISTKDKLIGVLLIWIRYWSVGSTHCQYEREEGMILPIQKFGTFCHQNLSNRLIKGFMGFLFIVSERIKCHWLFSKELEQHNPKVS